MPTCPACRTEQTRRVAGACLNCGARVQVHKGYWYRQDLGSPAVALVKHLEKKVSDSLSFGRPNRVVYSIPKKGLRYNRELVAAERLLRVAGGDFELASAAIDILFDDPKYNWKTRDSLIYIERDFLLALAIARGNQEQAEKERLARLQAFQAATSREDIFS